MSYHQTIYNLLRGYGLSEAGALGVLGNWECESNCEPYRVQGDFQPSRALSKAYVEKIEDRRMTGEQFAGDGKGFGLAQWTHPSRKIDLYNYWLNSSHRIDSCELQCEFAIHELTRDYSGLLLYLKTAESIWDCVDKVCRQYERPAVNNVDVRYQAALRIRNEIDSAEIPMDTIDQLAVLKPIDQSTVGQVTSGGWETMPVWEPGVLEYGDKGVEVRLLQDLLCCHDYYCTPDGIFGKDTQKKLTAFQNDAGLEPDGSCGPQTWKALGVNVWEH